MAESDLLFVISTEPVSVCLSLSRSHTSGSALHIWFSLFFTANPSFASLLYSISVPISPPKIVVQNDFRLSNVDFLTGFQCSSKGRLNVSSIGSFQTRLFSLELADLGSEQDRTGQDRDRLCASDWLTDEGDSHERDRETDTQRDRKRSAVCKA